MNVRRFYKIRSAVAQELYEYSMDSAREGLQELSEESVCYLAGYDDTEQLGLIYLGLKLPKDDDDSRTIFWDWHFLKVDSGYETTAADYENQSCLRTIPPIAFKTCFYLNVSEPCWVKLQYMDPFNDFKRLHLPLPLAIAGAKKASRIPQAPQVILDPESEFAFFKIRCKYFHWDPPLWRYHFLSDFREKKERSSGDLDGEIPQGAPSSGVEGEGSQAEPNCGRIRQFQILYDIPLVMSAVSRWTPYEDLESEDENGDYNEKEDEDSGCSGREKENDEEKDELSGCSSEIGNSKEEESKDYSEEEEDENDYKEEENEDEDWGEDWDEDWDEDWHKFDTFNGDIDRLSVWVVLMDIDIFKPQLTELESDMRKCMISNPGAMFTQRWFE